MRDIGKYPRHRQRFAGVEKKSCLESWKFYHIRKHLPLTARIKVRKSSIFADMFKQNLFFGLQQQTSKPYSIFLKPRYFIA